MNQTLQPAAQSSVSHAPVARLSSWVESFQLVITMVMPLAAVGVEVMAVVQHGTIELADPRLMFLHTEVIGMNAGRAWRVTP